MKFTDIDCVIDRKFLQAFQMGKHYRCQVDVIGYLLIDAQNYYQVHTQIYYQITPIQNKILQEFKK